MPQNTRDVRLSRSWCATTRYRREFIRRDERAVRVARAKISHYFYVAVETRSRVREDLNVASGRNFSIVAFNATSSLELLLPVLFMIIGLCVLIIIGHAMFNREAEDRTDADLAAPVASD
jgi:hypothetical protein